MADQRITELVELSQGAVASGDVLPIVDISSSQTKKVQVKSLIQAGFNLADSSTLDISKINQSSVAKLTGASIAPNTLTYDKIQQVGANKLLGRSATTGNVEEIDCTVYIRTLLDDANAAAARSTLELGVVATGDTINTALLENLSVTTGKINDLAVTAGKLASDAVETAKILDGAVTSAKIQTSGITGANVSAGAIDTVHLAASGVTLAKMAASSVGTTQLVDSGITQPKLAADAVATINILDSGITQPKLASGAVDTINLVDSGVTFAKLASGSVDTVNLVDSGITQPKLASGAVATINLADSGITQPKLASDSVDTINIIDAAVTLVKMASGSVDTAQLVASGITQEKLAADAVSTINLVDSGITQLKLASGAVDTINLVNSGITTAKLASGAVTIEKLSLSAGELSGTVITASSIPSGSYETGSISTDAIEDNAVTFAKIQQVASGVLLGRASAGNGNVESITLTEAGRALLDDADAAAQRTTLGLGTLAVQNTVASGDYDAGSIVTADIADGAITTAKFVDSGVTTIKIANANVTADKLASDSVTTVKIIDSGVTTAKIANGAVSYAKIQATSTSDVLLGRSSASGGTVEEIPCTSAARSILDDASVADIRTTLGLGTLATQNGSFSGTSTGTNTGDQTITLSGDVTGTGTGAFATTIANSAITSVKILDSAVTTAKIIDSGVTAIKLSDNSAVIVAGSTPTGDGDFIGQQWLNTNTGFEYTWNGAAWQRESGLATAVISGDTVYSFTTSYPDSFSASIAPSLNAQVATRFFAGPASGIADAAPTFRAITADDLPKATSAALGVAQAGTGLITVSGIFNHANSVASGVYYKVTVDEQGHVSFGEASLVADDIPSIPASKITTGTFGSGFIEDEAILASKLANYSVSQFGEAPPTADFIGQFFFNPLEKDLYLWDGNVWNPVGISIGEIIFGGTYNASGNTIASVSADGAGIGLSIGQPLPAASVTFNRYYVVVESGGTGTSPAPETELQPPDLLLCNGTAWVEIDVSSTYLSQAASNVAFSPAGTIGSTNVQSAIEEVNTECRNVDNVASGILSAAYGGTGQNTYATGDILVASGTVLAKKAVGANGQVLTADSAFGTGVRWATPASGTVLSVSATSPIAVVSGTTTPVISIPDASTSARGSVQLTDSTSTTSSSLAATATAVKSAFDLANAALPRAGGTITGAVIVGTTGSIQFEGSTDDAFETTLTAADPTADHTITLPNVNGTVITTGDTGTVTNTMLAGSIADTKLNTISTAGKVSNSATTATSANTLSAIVARDGSGNFSAGTISATIDEGTF